MLFDFKKRFGLTDRSILMANLEAYEMPPWVLDRIDNFLTDRKQRVNLAYNNGMGISQSWSTTRNQIEALAFLSNDKRHHSQWRQPLEVR